MIEKELLSMLTCPACQGVLSLASARDELICQAERLAYPVIESIPVLMAAEARRIPQDEALETMCSKE